MSSQISFDPVDCVDGDENLPEWVQAKITKAVDYLDSARDYMSSKDETEEEPVEEAAKPDFLDVFTVTQNV